MAEIGNTAVFRQVDADNNSGTVPTFAEGMAPSQLNDSARALQGALTREWNWRNVTLTSGGSADVQTLTYAVAPAAYYNGQEFGFIAGFTNTGSATMNVNTLGAVTMKKMVAGVQTALAAGDIVAGNFYKIVRNAAGSAFIVTSGITTSVSDASETVKGIVELATDAETETGTDTARAITPANLTAKEATTTEYRANTADRILTTDIVHTSAAEVTLTDAATIAVDMSSFINAVVTLGGNRALGNPTNEIAGRSGYIRIVQDATGSRTLTYGTDWEFAGGTAPTLSTAANAQDMLFYQVIAADRVLGNLIKAIA